MSPSRAAALRFVLVLLVGSALLFALFQLFLLNESMMTLLLPPPEVG